MATDTNWPHWLSVTASVLYYAVYPVFLVLKALWYIVILLSTPFMYVGRLIANVSLIPWRIFARFEALWCFLGSAVVLGLLLGLFLHYTMRAFIVVLRLDRTPAPNSVPPKGHDAISYRKAREARNKRKQLEDQQRLAAEARLIASQPLIQEVVREARKLPLSGALANPLSPSISGPSRPGLLQETILEHSDEDDDDTVF